MPISGPSSAALPSLNGWFRLTWADPGGTRTAWRIYYRRAGASTWLLYQDNVPLGSEAGINLMDELTFSVGYDFAVSAINGTTGEGPLSAAVLGITLAATTFTAMLHLAGAGAVAGNAMPLQLGLPPKFIDETDRVFLLPFGRRAGVTRWGPVDWHQIELHVTLTAGPGDIRSLIALLSQSQLGKMLYYRDVYGHLLTVSPMPGWKLDPEPASDQNPTVLRYLDIHLDEVANTYQPSVSSGSALGFRGQAAGSVVALDVTESAA